MWYDISPGIWPGSRVSRSGPGMSWVIIDKPIIILADQYWWGVYSSRVLGLGRLVLPGLQWIVQRAGVCWAKPRPRVHSPWGTLTSADQLRYYNYNYNYLLQDIAGNRACHSEGHSSIPGRQKPRMTECLKWLNCTRWTHLPWVLTHSNTPSLSPTTTSSWIVT